MLRNRHWQGDPHSKAYGPEVLEDLKKHHDPLYGNFSRLLQTTFDEAAVHFEDKTIDLIHIDGYHTYEAVRNDFETWLPKMSEKGVMIFHDTNVREKDFGIWKFWAEVKNLYPHFEFTHTHGLGLLAVGQHVPQSLQRLVNASQEESDIIKEFFFQLGLRLESEYEIQVLKQTIQTKDETINEVIKSKEQQLLQQSINFSQSGSYKLGRCLTWPLRKIKSL
jgi:O-antigen biosynthesis protein